MVVMSLVYALSAYPAGVLSDGVSKRFVLGLGLVFLILADLLLARADSVRMVLVGSVLWGLHMGFTQGILSAMIANATPPDLKGTAFGLFNLVNGIFMLLASVVAGWLWDVHGPEVTFFVGGTFSFLALILLVMRRT